MSKSEIDTINYKLEPAHLDWLDIRTQIAIGMVALFFLCLANFLSATQLNVTDNVILPSSFRYLIPCFSLSLRVADFALYYGSCLLTALIALEITGRFGNRCGAGCAMWAALLFCVSPDQAYFCTAACRAARFIAFVILFLAFRLLRSGMHSGKYKVWFLFLLVAIFSFDAYLSQSYSNNFYSYLRKLFFPVEIPYEGLVQSYILLITCFIAALLFFARFFLDTISNRAFAVVVLCYLTTITAVSFHIFEYFCFPWSMAFDESVRSLVAPALLAITFSLACLPAIDNTRIGISRTVGIIGVITLIVLTVNLERLFTSWGHMAPSVGVLKF